MAENKKDILKMAMIYTQEGRWDKAVGEYKKLLTLDPTDYNIHNMLGDVYSKKEEDALAYQSYIMAAEAYAKQGLGDKAAIIYKKIGKLNADKLPEADKQKAILIKRNTVAEKLIEEGQIDKAIEEYKEILKINPANFDTYQKLGELFSQKGDQKEALSYYKKIVDVYFKNRLYKKALPIYQKILEMQPDSIATREKIAEIYEREGNETDAKREYLFLCEFYWKEKNMEKTEFFSQKAIEFKSIEAHFFKGAALAMKKDYAEAKKEMDMLLKFKANHSGALMIVAEIQRDTNAVDDAITTLAKVTKADIENTDAYILLGEIYTKKSLKKEAETSFLTAVNIFSKKHENEKALGLLRKVLEQDPESINVIQKMAELNLQTGKKREAADAYLKISEIYKKENMADKAQEFYKLAQENDPGNSTIVDNAKKTGSAPAKAPEPAKPAPLPEIKAAPEKPAAMPPMDTVKPAPLPPVDTVKPGPAKPADTVKTAPMAPIDTVKPAPPQQGAPAPKQEQTEPALKIQRGMFYDMSSTPTPSKQAAPNVPPPQPPAQKPPVKQEPPAFLDSLPDLGDIKFDVPPVSKKQEAPPPPPPPKRMEMEPLPEFDLNSKKKPSDQIKEMEDAMGFDTSLSMTQSKEDVPSMIAMGDSLVKTGSFDEAIEMYQKALSLDPNNDTIKNKLNMAYSKYAGVPMPDPAAKEAERKRKEEEERKRNEEEEKKKKELEAREAAAKDAAVKNAAAKDTADRESAKKKEEEDRKKKEEEERKKKDEEARKKKDDEEKRKREDEEKRKQAEEEAIEEPEISEDFVTVTTAEIFMKQGLLTEAEKILNKILGKEPDNMEARMRLNELKKLLVEFGEEEKKPAPGPDEDKGPKGSKVSYI